MLARKKVKYRWGLFDTKKTLKSASTFLNRIHVYLQINLVEDIQKIYFAAKGAATLQSYNLESLKKCNFALTSQSFAAS